MKLHAVAVLSALSVVHAEKLNARHAHLKRQTSAWLPKLTNELADS